MRILKFNLRPFWVVMFGLLLIALVCHTPGERSASALVETNGKNSGAQIEQPLSLADGGSWSGLISTTTVPVHLSLLPDNRLLYWGRDKAADGNDVGGKTNTYLSDPLYPEMVNTTTINTCPDPVHNNCPVATNLFCSGHSFLPDGRLLVSGGHLRLDDYPSSEGLGEPHLNIFDYRTNTWTRAQQNMPKGRWYPYNVTLANGETLVLAGTYWTGGYWTVDHMTVPKSATNDEPNIRTLAGGVTKLTDNSTGLFPPIDRYPYISLTSSGKVFVATPSSVPGLQVGGSPNSRLLDPYATNSGNGQGVFTAVANPANPHTEGTSVMYGPDQILMLGGLNLTASGPTTRTAEVINLTDSTPRWTQVGAMAVGRHYPTSTLLPDGKVLVTGGTSCNGTNNLNCGPNNTYGGAVQTPELWDPENPTQWVQMNPTTSGVPRVYHSVAMLMPDARVLVGGGGLPLATGETGTGGVLCVGDAEKTFACKGAGHANIEYFSPPYLFKSDGSPATRPAITSAPASIAYGQTFTVGVGNGDASTVGKVVLIRLPSVTHTYNQDQRRVILSYTGAGDSINVTSPANGNICPPGPYMMFLISNNGRNTPSVAKIIRVGTLSLDRTSQAFPTNSTEGSLDSYISIKTTSGLNWTAQTDANASSWVTITSGASGTGDGTINFIVAPNTGVNAAVRSGRIIVKVPGQESSAQEFTLYQSIDFTDVNYPPMGGIEFSSAINKVLARSITSGCLPGKYCPSNNISRAEMAIFLARALRGVPDAPPAPTTQRFIDVPLGYWAGSYIEYIARREITLGCEPTKFCPDKSVTRAEMAVFLVRALGIKNPPVPATQRFTDVPLNYWAASSIEELARRGISMGCEPGLYCPERLVRRDEMAVFLVRAFGL